MNNKVLDFFGFFFVGFLDPLSTNHATDQATCRMETAAFLVHWHQMTTTGDHSGPPPPGGEENFDSAKALMSMLSEEVSKLSM